MIFRLTAMALALVTLIAACADNERPVQPRGQATSSAPAPAAARAWMDRFCGVSRELSAAVRNGQDTGGARTPEELRRSYTIGLAAGVDGLAMATKGLGELGLSPVDGGDVAVGKLADTFGELSTLFMSTKRELDALPPGFGEEDVGRVLARSGAVPKLSSLYLHPFEAAPITQAMRDAGSAPGSACLGVLPRG